MTMVPVVIDPRFCDDKTRTPRPDPSVTDVNAILAHHRAAIHSANWRSDGKSISRDLSCGIT